jgi:hypothetical protein
MLEQIEVLKSAELYFLGILDDFEAEEKTRLIIVLKFLPSLLE